MFKNPILKNLTVKLIFRFISFLLILLGLLCPNVTNAESLTGQLQFSEGTYRINAGDILSLNVYNQSDLSETGILVRADGNASFNGIGEVPVAGKTIQEASQLLERQIGELVKDPRINLSVTDSRPPTIYLSGAVMHPGMLSVAASNDASPFDSANKSAAASGFSRMDFRISNILGASGGVKLNADLANVMITRNGQPYKTVNLWNMLKKGEMDNDIMLQSGDSVFIPELPVQALDDQTYQILLSSTIGPKNFPVRVIGFVKQPGIFDLSGNSPYLNSAISKAGGFLPESNQKVIAIRRFSGENQFSTLFINPKQHDFMLRPNDIIYISEQKVFKAGRFADTANKILSPFTSTMLAFFDVVLLRSYLK